MTPPDEPQHRTYYQPDPDSVEVRESDGESGVFRVRMPIATTGEVRNEGDDPLSRDELSGMASQVDAGGVGVFLDHGQSDVAASRYSAVEKVGEWEEPETQSRDADDTTELVATARLMDPETLPAETGAVREALASLKEQVKRDMTLSSSIGWRDDEASEGGVDLMEASIVGIPADPRTTSQDAAMAMARSVLDEADVPEAQREQLVDEFRAVVMGSDQEQEMTDEEDSQSADEADTDRDEPDGMDQQEFRESMLEMQQQQTELLRSLVEERADDDGDDDDEEDEDDTEEDEEDDGGENDADEPDDTSDADDPDRSPEEEIAELREELADVRASGDVETPDEGESDAERDADETTTEDRSDGPDWRA